MKLISSGGGSGKSTVTRYISERDRDPEKEGKEKRPLFSKEREGMTYRQADKVLAKGQDAPDKEDVIHIAVSLRPNDFERLGSTNELRLERFMEVTREALQEVEEDLDARDMEWVAGIHQNRANPHVHIAINKNVTDRETGKNKRIETIPRDMRGNKPKEREEELEKEERGKIAHRFDEAIDRVAGPVTRISFQLADRDVVLRRELVPAGREPNGEERIVGSWILSEANGRPGDEQATREREQLRDAVRDIDRGTARRGEAQVAAYISPEDLREALDKGTVKPLNQAGQRHAPYDAGDVEHEPTPREPVLEARTVLGRELAARYRSEYFSEKVDACVEQKAVRRYKIHDVSLGVERKSSIADLKQRGEARGQRAAELSGAETGTERREIKSATAAEDFTEHHPNVIEIDKAHTEQLNKLTHLRDKELDEHDRTLSLASRVQREYRARGEELPTPIIPRPVLDELHEQAVERRDPERIYSLDVLRHQLATEFGGHARNDHSAARLSAQAEIARQDQRVSERRAETFEQSCHLRKWEINGQRLSLSDVDRESRYRQSEVEFQTKRAEFYENRLTLWGSFSLPSAGSLNPMNSVKGVVSAFKDGDNKSETGEAQKRDFGDKLKGAAKEYALRRVGSIGNLPFGITLNPIRRAEYREQAAEAREAARVAQEKVDALKPLREAIVGRIDERRAELSQAVALDRAMSDALSSLRSAEAADRSATGRQMPEPSYKGWELRRLEADAGLLRDPEATRQFEHEVGPGRENINLEGRASRAFAREVHADLVAEEAAARLETFTKHREHYPLSYRDAQGELQTGSLSDVTPRSSFERLTRFITETSEERALRTSLERAAAETYQNLVGDRDQTADYARSMQQIGGGYRSELREIDATKELPKPEFTRKELADIERFGEALADTNRHNQYQEFVKEVIEDNRVGNHPVGQAFSDLMNTKLGRDTEPEKSWEHTIEPHGVQTAGGPPAPEAAPTPSQPVEITGASASLESEAGGGLAALL